MILKIAINQCCRQFFDILDFRDSDGQMKTVAFALDSSSPNLLFSIAWDLDRGNQTCRYGEVLVRMYS